MRNDNRLRLRVIAVAILFIIVGLCFGGALNVMSFKKNYLESLAAGYHVGAMSTQRTIEYSVRYGKPLDKFSGMQEVLNNLKSNLEQIDNARIVSRYGEILYDLDGPVHSQWLPWSLQKIARFDSVAGQRPYGMGFVKDEYHVLIPLRDKHGGWIGTLDVFTQAEAINRLVNDRVWSVAQITVVIALVSLNFMVFLLFAFAIVDLRGQLRRWRLLALVAAIFILAQLTFCLSNVELLQKSYIEMARSSMSVLARSVKNDVNSVVALGVSYDRLVGLDRYLGQIISNSPEIDRIAVTDNRGEGLYRAPADRSAEGIVPGEALQCRFFQGLMEDKNGQGGTIHIWLSRDYINTKIKELASDSAAVAGLFLLLLMETILLLPLLRKYDGEDAADLTEPVPHSLRPVAFLFYFAVSLELSVCVARTGVWPLSSALAVGLGAAVGAGWSRRRQPDAWWLYVGGVLTAVGGVLLALLFPSRQAVLAALLLSGAGWGLAAAGWHGFGAGDGDKGKNVSLYTGMSCGSLAGCIAGALLADRMGALIISGGTLLVLGLVLWVGNRRKQGEIKVRGITDKKFVLLTGLLTAAPLVLIWSVLSLSANGVGLFGIIVVFLAGSYYEWVRRARKKAILDEPVAGNLE